ncbi:MAG TPA: hypothetical protein VM243_19445 [Phycisphaerae bacterium]|nr:hypothetical protein [Phycisphaerae bacterium]
MKAMKALLWKDCRVNGLVLIVGAVLVVGPFLIAVPVNFYSERVFGALPRPWPQQLTTIGLASLSFSLLTMVMLGGNAIAGERADRSAEFLAYLPPSRRAIITSKAVLAIGAGLAVWLVNLGVIYVLAPRTARIPEELAMHLGDVQGDTLVFLAALSVYLFGSAWLGSCLVASPAIATGLGFVPPFITGCLLLYFLGPEHPDIDAWYYTLAVTLGVLFFVAGVAYYVRRVEP